MARNHERDEQQRGIFIHSEDQALIIWSNEETDNADNESRNLAFFALFLLC